MKVALIVLMLSSMLWPGNPMQAHQPRLISGDQTVEIINPEISQAFYGTLRGEPDEYRITATKEFDLYLNILVPDLPNIRKDYTLQVFYQKDDGQNVHLFELDGTQHNWTTFYEPFAGDNYFHGPESDKPLPAGIYTIKVSNPDNEGKYVLSVGRQETFTLAETIQMIRRLPELKRFFEKSPWTAYFNLVGLFMLLSALLLAAALYGLYRIAAKFLKR
jgi:hypothetical protein